MTVLAFMTVLALILAACASSGSPTTPAGSSQTVWLCQPGAAPDPCAYSEAATSLQPNGSQVTTTLAGMVPAAQAARFDCFYVYPTSSSQTTPNANLAIQTGEIAAAVSQAALFSGVCSVWAPMYRQQTTTSAVTNGLLGTGPQALETLHSTFNVAFASLLSAWTDFLAHDNDGRPLILIGDSQGAAILIHLISTQIDHQPSVLKRLVVAIIIGGNLQMPVGKTVGATFSHVPLCTSASQTGCAIAFSSFPSTPPQDSLFGRPGQGVSLQSDQTATAGQQVACVNPAALRSGTGTLSPYFLTQTQTGLAASVATPWVSYPNLYSATCESRGGATWLQINDMAGPGDTRPVVTETAQTLGPRWGYHVYDVNLALGNLVHDVAAEEAAWMSTHH